MRIICLLLQLFTIVLLARLVLSWIPTTPGTFLDSANRALTAVTEPILAPIRSVIPPVRSGAMAFDLSPLIVFVAIILFTGWVC